MPRVVLVRHGETDWAREGRHTGITDAPLNPVGEAAAKQLSERLAGGRYNWVWSSPRQRARRTAELAGFNGTLEIVEDLQEWNYGRYEGLKTAEIRAEAPDWMVFRDGAPGGESPSEVSDRADRVVARLREATGDVLIFSHGHFLRALAARWLELPLAAGAHFILAPAAVSILGYEHGNRAEPALIRWNGK
ncbi:MAG: histidine phosphatase family protein [Verrucomicrobiota bacterium]